MTKANKLLNQKDSKATYIRPTVDLSHIQQRAEIPPVECRSLKRFYQRNNMVVTYGCDGLDMSVGNVNRLNVCWNDLYRKKFWVS